MSTPPAVIFLTKQDAKALAKKIKESCISAHDNIQDAGRWLIEFRDREGWHALGYKNWSACVAEEFKSTHGGRAQVFRLIQNAEVAENIAKNGTLTEKVSLTRETKSELPIRQTQELAKVPPAIQSKVLEIAIELGSGKATAATVKRAIASLKPAKEIFRDDTGYVIPDKILPLWNRREEVREIQKAIARARTLLKAAHEKQPDPLWQAVNLQAIGNALKNAQGDLEMAVPAIVCATCQGRATDTCTSCKGRGFISRHHYDRCVPEELKAIRAKSCVP